MKKKDGHCDDFREALIKKALGYDATEVVEEYKQSDEGEVVLTRKKITTKNVPPDIAALKMILDGEQQASDLSALSDEELEQEKQRLLAVLADKTKTEVEKKGEKNCKTQLKKTKSATKKANSSSKTLSLTLGRTLKGGEKNAPPTNGNGN